jgi:arginine/lysine/ornithine decarboxylase
VQDAEYYTSTHKHDKALCSERPGPAGRSLPIRNEELLKGTVVSQSFNFHVSGSGAYRIYESTEVEEDCIEGNHTRGL